MDDSPSDAGHASGQADYILKLYVFGMNRRARSALNSLNKLCESELKGHYDIEVIDVRENPEVAKEEMLVALPTLIRELPEPVRKIVGDLSDREKLLAGLEIVTLKA